MKKRIYHLQDYKSLRTPFCFLDETGQLNNERDRFFALGMVKCTQPYYLYREIRTLRDKHHFYDEIKWTKLSHKSISVLLKVLDIFFKIPGVKFSCIVLPKDDLDFQKYFQGNLYKAYESFAILQLKGNISYNEILCVLADHVSVPSNVRFEVNVKRKVNQQLGRLAVHGVCRVDSKGVELVQIADLLLGAVVYDLKLKSHLIPSPSRIKRRFLNNLKHRVSVKTFATGLRKQRFNVWIFEGK